MTCALIIGLNPTLESLGVLPVYIVSIVIYILSAVLYLLILIFKELEPPDFDSALREGEDHLVAELQNRRGQP
jgi:hypothetical protein